MSQAPFSDIQAHIARLFIYPIKSCAGMEVTDIDLYDTGLDLDRAWMLVDADGVFVSQREQPRMALVQPQIRRGELVLRAPGMLALHVSIDSVQEPTRVEVWDDAVPAYDMGDIAAQWFSDFLHLTLAGVPAHDAPRYRLVRFDPEHNRLANKKWTGGADAPVMFSDGYPILVLSQASVDSLNARLAAEGHAPVGVERFRPNVVFAGLEAHDEDRLPHLTILAEGGDAGGEVRLGLCKPCTRCSIPNIDHLTAESTPHVNDALQAYRADPRMNGALTFGMNAIIRAGVGAKLRVGQAVTGNYQFD
ncbi:MAG: hypothetical protein RLZZ126_1473 [Pseudomonadota bacterium]|jgi:uncharacterized protein YcbX